MVSVCYGDLAAKNLETTHHCLLLKEPPTPHRYLAGGTILNPGTACGVTEGAETLLVGLAGAPRPAAGTGLKIGVRGVKSLVGLRDGAGHGDGGEEKSGDGGDLHFEGAELFELAGYGLFAVGFLKLWL